MSIVDLDAYLNRKTFVGGRASAIASHAEYRQYDGYFEGDEWGVVVFAREYKTKGGVLFFPGDRAMGRLTDMPNDELARDFGTRVAYDVYDPRTTHICLVLGSDIGRFISQEEF